MSSKIIIPVDFETESIQYRPIYPPKPVGVAVKLDGKNKYLAWGHPVENNCTLAQARKILLHIFTKQVPLFHNAAFDIAVAMQHFNLPFPKIDYHDTLFLAYLNDPRDESLSLKPLAKKYLGMKPVEQDKLKEWILINYYKLNNIKETKKDPWAAHICTAPGGLVEKYAIGDIVRVEKLFKFFYKKILKRGMGAAYEREKKCMPIFEGMSKTGLRVAKNSLIKDLKIWEKTKANKENQIKKILGDKNIDLQSSKQLGEALDAAGKMDMWFYTSKGNKSTARNNLINGCNDKKLIAALSTYYKLNTFISTFAIPWINSAKKFDGRVYPSFNQVRSPEEYNGRGRGTRTGRPSSSNPNFLNVPRNQKEAAGENMPWLRNYILPDEGTSFIIHDYDQQELRILAHYEDAELLNAYNENAETDAHILVGEEIERITGIKYPREIIKPINFGVIYGMGVRGTAKILGIAEEAAKTLLNAHSKALPGIRELKSTIQNNARHGDPIYTWGGREYFAELARIVNGELRDFYYKLLNYLIQGSAADCTKEAMILVNEALQIVDGRIALQVYDEIVSCVPKGKEKRGAQLQKEAMESVKFDVPMLAKGKVGYRSWGSAE